MKKTINILATIPALAAMVLLTILSGCHKNDTPAPADVNSKILSSHGWKLQSLQIDGNDNTALYAGMTLAFTNGTYTTTKGSPVWPASGTWLFSSTDAKTITRDDLVEVTIESIADDQLVLSLMWNKNTFGGGRQNSLSGKHVYTFVK